jgi:hypothetical protein
VTLTFLFGLFALADGIVNVMSAIGAQEYENWWLVLLAGISGILVGALTFFNPGATALMLLFFIALWAIRHRGLWRSSPRSSCGMRSRRVLVRTRRADLGRVRRIPRGRSLARERSRCCG